ncbi:fungal-specific transcription factor domain-containing protein [Durotheca rogersii]|uniref:fungal-specific transcription factor domain-containing protein n=1 Tax=Durotheca rogersii TaxID=419775 RepID=UPI00221EA629|nr:fungal-specific transcription factor domain-containing protein [Durotheca rogersii]KAI5863719.1 fungal-specific transcription factor domain-containing protein [Durotheca rogersii]
MVLPKSCHNCRARRLRCDRSVPACHKCTSAGQECLGYGRLFKWVRSEPSRARVTTAIARTSVYGASKSDHDGSQPDTAAYSGTGSRGQSGHGHLEFPPLGLLLTDLDWSSRRYLDYFLARFCQDLVIYDSPRPGANPFRDLAHVSQTYPYLREIIIAASALHFSNAMRPSPSRPNADPRVGADAFVDALRARGRAIKALQAVVQHQELVGGAAVDETEKDAVLAAVLFFVNFTLLDSGKVGWRAHMKFVGRLLSMRVPGSQLPQHDFSASTQESERDAAPSPDPKMSHSLAFPDSHSPASSLQTPSVYDYIASDSMAYYIWSLALDSLVSSRNRPALDILTPDGDDTKILLTLLRTEANSYHSCPARLLYIIYRTSKLAMAIKSSGTSALSDEQVQSCLELLEEARAFDADAWATDVNAKIEASMGYADEIHIRHRKHIAVTYRAAVCLYILLVAPGLSLDVYRRWASSEATESSLLTFPNIADLTTTILRHISLIPTDSPPFKFATWPVFLTGVEATSPSRRMLVLDRLSDMRSLHHWGMLTSTMETLIEIWQIRDSSSATYKPEAGGDIHVKEPTTPDIEGNGNNMWLEQLKNLKIDSLIV